MFCPYCGIDHEPNVEFTDEHVVPYAVGGSNVLEIRVCKDSNNTLGGLVDKPFIELFPVRANRFFLGLRGTDGTEPTLDLGGTSQIDGKNVRIDYTISRESKQLRIVTANVTKTPTEGGEHWKVSGGAEIVRNILEGKLKSLKAQGKQMKSEAGEVLNLENLSTLLNAARKETMNPSVLMKLKVDRLTFVRFFGKLALSVGHYILGESFSRSASAGMLRRAIHAKDLETARIPGASIWPNINAGQEQLFVWFRKQNSHILGILEGEPPVFFASLFGTYEAFIPLGPVEPEKTLKLSDNGRILQIDLPSREIHDRTFVEYLTVLATERRIP